MKKSVLTLVAALVLALVIVNQTNKSETVAFLEERVISPEEKAWQQVPLEGLFQANSYYQFDGNKMQSLLEDAGADELRFYLGVRNNDLQVTAGTVTAGMESTTMIDSKRLTNHTIEWTNSDHSASSDGLSSTVSRHLLDANQAVGYLEGWNTEIQDAATLNDLVAYQGTRIKHFTISKAAVAYLMDQDNAQELALFWGLNQERKLTTVLLGVDENGKVLAPNENNLALDFTMPCPNTCDPKGNEIQYVMIHP